MKKLLLLIFVLCFSVNFAQTTLFVDEFNYAAGDLLTAHNWQLSGTSNTNPLTVTSPGLTFPSYPSVVGNALTMQNNGQDLFQTYTAVTSGSIYVAFLLQVSAAQTGDYFIAISPTLYSGGGSGQTTYYARTHLKAVGSGYSIGISKYTELTGGAVYGTTVLSFNTTYLVVIKHTFVAGDMNDAERVFVFSTAAPSTEPSTSEVGPYTETTKVDPVDLSFVTLRQGSSSSAAGFIIDGIRIATNWGIAVTGVASGVEENNPNVPTSFSLSQNYPNPFNPSTVIKYQVSKNTFVNVSVFDILGNQVRNLVREEKAAGSYEITFDASNMPSGVYFYSIQTSSFTQTKKMILMK